jgi:hypothetical protein
VTLPRHLNGSNVMGWLDAQRFVPTGIIDLDQSFAGRPIAERGAMWWHILERDRQALAAFLAAAGLPERREPDFPRLALAWALMTPSWQGPDASDVQDVGTLDELATRWFGP